jgi:hypothetical protein
LSNWKKKALCAADVNSEYWFSYKKEEIQYAKNICKKCSVRKECLMSAWQEEYVYGVNGGFSEFEILLETWKEAKKVSDDNWSRSNKILQRMLRKTK